MAKSGAASQGMGCQDCHMPEGAHTFPGAHDVDLLRRSLNATVRQVGQTYAVTLHASGIGHRVPTGDPFRRVVFELVNAEHVVYSHTLWRHYRMGEESFDLVEDTTIATPEKGLDTTHGLIAEPTQEPTGWRLWMYFGDQRFENKLEPHQVRSLIASGKLGGQSVP